MRTCGQCGKEVKDEEYPSQKDGFYLSEEQMENLRSDLKKSPSPDLLDWCNRTLEEVYQCPYCAFLAIEE